MAATAIPVCSGRSRKRSEEHDDAHEADQEAAPHGSPASAGIGAGGGDGDAGGAGAVAAVRRLGGRGRCQCHHQLFRQQRHDQPECAGRDHQLGQLQHRYRLRSDLQPAERAKRHPQPRDRFRLRDKPVEHRRDTHFQRHGVPDQYRRDHLRRRRGDQRGRADRLDHQHDRCRLQCRRGQPELRLQCRREHCGHHQLCRYHCGSGWNRGLPCAEHHQLRGHQCTRRHGCLRCRECGHHHPGSVRRRPDPAHHHPAGGSGPGPDPQLLQHDQRGWRADPDACRQCTRRRRRRDDRQHRHLARAEHRQPRRADRADRRGWHRAGRRFPGRFRTRHHRCQRRWLRRWRCGDLGGHGRFARRCHGDQPDRRKRHRRRRFRRHPGERRRAAVRRHADRCQFPGRARRQHPGQRGQRAGRIRQSVRARWQRRRQHRYLQRRDVRYPRIAGRCRFERQRRGVDAVGAEPRRDLRFRNGHCRHPGTRRRSAGRGHQQRVEHRHQRHVARRRRCRRRRRYPLCRWRRHLLRRRQCAAGIPGGCAGLDHRRQLQNRQQRGGVVDGLQCRCQRHQYRFRLHRFRRCEPRQPRWRHPDVRPFRRHRRRGKRFRDRHPHRQQHDCHRRRRPAPARRKHRIRCRCR